MTQESPEADKKALKRFKNFDTFLIPKEKLEGIHKFFTYKNLLSELILFFS